MHMEYSIIAVVAPVAQRRLRRLGRRSMMAGNPSLPADRLSGAERVADFARRLDSQLVAKRREASRSPQTEVRHARPPLVSALTATHPPRSAARARTSWFGIRSQFDD